MRLADMATRPHHGTWESHEQLYEHNGAQTYDQEAARGTRGESAEANVKYYLYGDGYGKHDLRPAQRQLHPANSKRETSSVQKYDWPSKSFVSSPR